MTCQSPEPRDMELVHARNVLAHRFGWDRSVVLGACRYADRHGTDRDKDRARVVLEAIQHEEDEKIGREAGVARRSMAQMAVWCAMVWVFILLAVFGLPVAWGWLTAGAMVRPVECSELGVIGAECSEAVRGL